MSKRKIICILVFLTVSGIFQVISLMGNQSPHCDEKILRSCRESLRSAQKEKVSTAKRVLLNLLWSKRGLSDALRTDDDFGPAVKIIEAIRNGDTIEGVHAIAYCEAVGAYDVIVPQIASSSLPICIAALDVIEKRHYTQALPLIKQTLLENLEAISGGGAELQHLREQYLKRLWMTYLSLSNDLESDWTSLPSADEFRRLLD